MVLIVLALVYNSLYSTSQKKDTLSSEGTLRKTGLQSKATFSSQMLDPIPAGNHKEQLGYSVMGH